MFGGFFGSYSQQNQMNGFNNRHGNKPQRNNKYRNNN